MKQKIFTKILSLMEYVEGQNNFEANELEVETREDGFFVESVCRNEYGGRYGNEDQQFICWSDTPNWVMNVLWSGRSGRIVLCEEDYI